MISFTDINYGFAPNVLKRLRLFRKGMNEAFPWTTHKVSGIVIWGAKARICACAQLRVLHLETMEESANKNKETVKPKPVRMGGI